MSISNREPGEVSRQEKQCQEGEPWLFRAWPVSRVELWFFLRCALGVPEAISGLSE